MKKRIGAVALSLFASTTLAATPTAEEMWAVIQQQQAEIANLKAQLATTDEEIKTRAGSEFSRGIYIGFWDEDDVLQAKRSNSGEGGN